MTPETPLVSIIIPTFNRVHLIGETLNSVLAQTYTNWECIVVDDGSTDNTAEVLAGYIEKDVRFQYHHRPMDRPKGANACRNYGYDVSKGEYIQWFDSDDLMLPEKLKVKIGYALALKVDIVVATHTSDDKPSIGSRKIEVFRSEEFYIDYILGKKPLITNDVMVKRAVVGKHRFDEDLHKGQEYEFFTRLFQQRLHYCFVDIPLTFYRKSENSISTNTSKGNTQQVESLIYLSKLLMARHPNNPGIVARAERQGRKTYKSLILKRNLKLIFRHFNFFRYCHHKPAIVFLAFIPYNYITKSGFDIIKSKMK